MLQYKHKLGIPEIMIGTESYLDFRFKIDVPKLMEFWICDPIPKKIFLPDLILTPNSVISKQIYNILAPLELYNVQLLPARIFLYRSKFFDEYWGLHIWNEIKCIDLEKSDVVINDGGGLSGTEIKKIFLDRKRLEKIPLQERLLFRMGEFSVHQIFHESLVEKIMAINPTGLRFIDIEDYHSDIMFQNGSEE